MADVTRSVGAAANPRVWAFLGEELPALPSGRPRDPYYEQGCHPDIVERVWDALGAALPRDCRAQAKGRPVLALPGSERIVAFARGTAYAVWVTPEDRAAARAAGAGPVHRWGNGGVTDLATAGAGWVWGRFLADEPRWLARAYDTAADGSS